MKKIILKPCPFCGNPPILRQATKEEIPAWNGTYKLNAWWTIDCSCYGGCMVKKKTFPDKLSLVVDWNRRRKANKLTYRKEENIIEVDE